MCAWCQILVSAPIVTPWSISAVLCLKYFILTLNNFIGICIRLFTVQNFIHKSQKNHLGVAYILHGVCNERFRTKQDVVRIIDDGFLSFFRLYILCYKSAFPLD